MSKHTCAPFYLHGLTLIPAWIGNHLSSKKKWEEIIYPFPFIYGEFLEYEIYLIT